MKKNLYKIILLLVTTLAMNSCNINEHKYVKKLDWINFEWASNKVAIFVPIKIQDIPDSFKAQLDLGIPNSTIYANTFKPFLKIYPKLKEKIDTVDRIFIYNNKIVGEIKNINIKLGHLIFKNKTLDYFTNFGHSLSLYKKEKLIPIIGSIGSGLFLNKYLIIDFKNHRIAILDTLNDYFNKIRFVKMRIETNRIKIPLIINGKERFFMFDTGSSLFPLIVYKDSWDSIRDLKSEIDTITVNSWGKPHSFFGAKIKATIQIGDYKIETNKFKVYADTISAIKQFYKKENILGIMGNSFFLNKTIIIDYKNKKFGITTSANSKGIVHAANHGYIEK